MVTNETQKTGHVAKASMKSVHMSTKHVIEICSTLRYKTTTEAKKILGDAIGLKKAIPFKQFNKDVGHKRGMAAGRYAPKAAAEVLKLISSVEANAQDLGFDTTSLKISRMLANRASSPMSGGRTRGQAKRTHVEIEVTEFEVKQKRKAASKKAKASAPKKVAEVKEEVKATPKPEVKETKTEVKEEVKTQETQTKKAEVVKEEPKSSVDQKTNTEKEQ